MKYATVLSSVLFLTACSTGPQASLAQRLANASPEKGKQIVLTACLQEAKWPIYQSAAYKGGGARVREQVLNSSSYDVRRVEAMCYKLGKATGSDKTALVVQCQTVIAERRSKYGSKGEAHFQRFEDVCRVFSA